jgi:epoxyqueuosine reductase
MKDESTEAVKRRAIELGFARVGIARVRELAEDFERYEAFIERGMHGSMQYLARHREARRSVDTPAVLEGARSVIVCAADYRIARRAAGRGLADARIARYAQGQDYHNFLRRKLRKLAAFVRTRTGAEARPVIDTAPVLERAWARLAGVGFVGKNGCVIAPGVGSFVLLGEVVTTAELVPDEPLESRCGACSLCLDACPTNAFAKPFVLDARKCVSFLTIEHDGSMPEALRSGVGDHLFGCDDCQDVCPYNKTESPPNLAFAESCAPDQRWSQRSVASLLSLDDAAFAALTVGSPLSRPGREGLVRNALIVLANIGTREHLPAIRQVLEREHDEVVRDAARWAIECIEASGRDA